MPIGCREVRVGRLELPHLSIPGPKPGASANSATPAWLLRQGFNCIAGRSQMPAATQLQPFLPQQRRPRGCYSKRTLDRAKDWGLNSPAPGRSDLHEKKIEDLHALGHDKMTLYWEARASSLGLSRDG
jgi:hypothetical protein